MKKVFAIFLTVTMCLILFTGCQNNTTNEQNSQKVISALNETIDINHLKNCTVAVSLEQGDAYVDDSGKMQMDLTVYSYELYDMVDIAGLAQADTIIRQGEEVKVSALERLDSGIVRINGGEENGGFDLATNDSTVYYEVGMDDAKAYYALGEVTLPVSDEFVYADASVLNQEATLYYPGDFLTEDAGITYDFTPDNTSVVIADGVIISMNKVYNP